MYPSQHIAALYRSHMHLLQVIIAFVHPSQHTTALYIHRMEHEFDPAFAEMLLDDEWWEAAEDRSADLVPKFSRHTHKVYLFEAMPLSLREWLLGHKGESCATKRYAFADNPTSSSEPLLPTMARLSRSTCRYHPSLRDLLSGPRRLSAR